MVVILFIFNPRPPSSVVPFSGFAAICWVLVVCVGISYDLIWWFWEVAGCFVVLDLGSLVRTNVAPDTIVSSRNMSPQSC